MTEPTTPTPPAASPPPATPAPVGQPVVPPSSTTMPAGTDYKAKFDGLRGAMMALKTQSEEQVGALQQQLRAATGESVLLQEKLSTAETRIVGLTGQLDGLPEIQEQASKVVTLEAQSERLETILRFPEIVGKTELVDVSAEGEDERFDRVNPFLDALLASTLLGDAFTSLATQMASQLGTGEWTGEGEAPPSHLPPPPPTPVPGDTYDDLRKQMLEAQRGGDYDKANKLMDVMSERAAKG